MHDDERFNDFLRHAAKDYNADATPPADAIWAAIHSDVAAAIQPRRRLWIPIGVGIAATLMIGVAVGRWTSPVPAAPVAAVTHPVSDDSVRSVAHTRAATLEHLADAEVFLTTVRADVKTGRTDADRAARSRELLSRTRLLLGASAERSPAVEQLLQDLELLLAEISALPATKASMDTKLFDETMRDGNILPRIRATLPAQPSRT
ncbi:MAG: hypothetical protein JWM95_4570 [Gemmatimonadetes bacterium]|nr:hypothetical protein [Gemmatimonadota bacterium]